MLNRGTLLREDTLLCESLLFRREFASSSLSINNILRDRGIDNTFNAWKQLSSSLGFTLHMFRDKVTLETQRKNRDEVKKKRKKRVDFDLEAKIFKFPRLSQVASIMQTRIVRRIARGGTRGSEFSALLSRETAKTLLLRRFLAATPFQDLVNRLARVECVVRVRRKKICLPTRYSLGCPKCAAICRSPGRPPDTVYLSPIRCTSANKREEGGKKKIGLESSRIITVCMPIEETRREPIDRRNESKVRRQFPR